MAIDCLVSCMTYETKSNGYLEMTKKNLVYLMPLETFQYCIWIRNIFKKFKYQSLLLSISLFLFKNNSIRFLASTYLKERIIQ